MKLGLSTLMFYNNSPEKGVELASKLDLECVEFFLESPHFFLNIDSDRLERIRELVDSEGLDVRTHGKFLDLNPVSLHSEVRDLTFDQTVKSFDLCESLGGEMVTIHPGRFWCRNNEDLFEQCKRWFQDYLEKMFSYGHNREISLALETGSQSADYPKNPEELLQTIERVEGVGVTLDVGHLYLAARGRGEGEEWVSDQIELLGDRIINVHLHDNSGLSDDHMPIGQGGINFDPIMDALRKYYDGTVILELSRLSEPFEEVKRTVEKIKSF